MISGVSFSFKTYNSNSLTSFKYVAKASLEDTIMLPIEDRQCLLAMKVVVYCKNNWTKLGKRVCIYGSILSDSMFSAKISIVNKAFS